MIKPCGLRWNAIGPLRTPAISRPNTTSIVRMRYSIILSQASGSAAGDNIQESQFVQPNKKRLKLRRIIGSGDLWVTEFVLTYDGIPSYTVSIMQFRDGQVTQRDAIFRRPIRPFALAIASG